MKAVQLVRWQAEPELRDVKPPQALPGGVVLLATQAGEIVRSTDDGKSFARLQPARPMAYYGVMGAAGGKAVLVGSEGVRVEAARD